MIYLNLFWIFFKVGIFGFGGGYAILPMIFQEIQVFGIMTADDFSNLVALSQVTPGPIAINAATYVGFKGAGIVGSCIATVAVSLPSFILIMTALMFINRFRENATVQAVLAGIKPATVGLMASAFIFMGETAVLTNMESFSWTREYFSQNLDMVGVAIFVIAYALIKLTKLGAIQITLLGGAMGVIGSLLWNAIGA